jgi:3-phosphoglycerate kinase
MANTFLAAQGYNMGKSLVEAESLDTARELMDQRRRDDSTAS